MDLEFAISLSVGCIAVIMLLASWMFKDKPGAKPARFPFRVFYIATIVLFAAILVDEYRTDPLVFVIVDLSLAIIGGSLLLGIMWRCNSVWSNRWVYLLGLVFIFIEMLIMPGSMFPSFVFVVLCSLLSSYLLLNRLPKSNTGDKGMAYILLGWSAIFLWEMFLGLEVGQSHLIFKESLSLIFTPVFISGITLFLTSSYMLDAQHELAQQAGTDPMTGLYNRRYFLDHAKKLLKSANRYEHPISVIMCDIDQFKSINDKYGHDTGDTVIKSFGNCLNKMLRNDDILARYGGEEFVILLPQANDLAVMLVAERMREEAEAVAIKIPNGQLRFTVSFGVCQVTDFSDIEISISEADTAMYQAKNSGRNRVCLYENREV